MSRKKEVENVESIDNIENIEDMNSKLSKKDKNDNATVSKIDQIVNNVKDKGKIDYSELAAQLGDFSPDEMEKLFDKLDIQFKKSTDLNNIRVDTYTYKINAFFDRDNKSYRLLHYHLRNWCEQNHGVWSSDLPNIETYPNSEAVVFPSLTFTGYNSFVNVSCSGIDNTSITISFNTQEIHMTEQGNNLLEARKNLKLQKEKEQQRIYQAREECIREPQLKIEKLQERLISSWRKNLKIGDTINGINLIINTKGKDLVEIQNRSSGKNYWFKRTEIHPSRQIQNEIDKLTLPFKNAIADCKKNLY